ncbi:MAG TPA: ATP-binding protein [Candidatus Methylomirabilis sp.]|nr:ATP-binding protein [Candidatus Methylomirabilis sp.]
MAGRAPSSETPHAAGSGRRPARFVLAWPALLATVLLLIALLGAYSLIESRRLQRDLGREITDRATTLIDILEAASKNAIASNALLEEAVTQRLLDNARFVDFLVARSPRVQQLIQRVVAENKLAKVELLDSLGHPISLPQVEASPPPGGRGTADAPGGSPAPQAPGQRMRMMMGWGMGSPGQSGPRPPEGQTAPGMPFMWGHRWWAGPRGDPSQLFPSLPKGARVRRFWEGSAFGVAVPAQSFRGVIAVHADAEYLLTFRREIGVEHLIEDLGRQSGVAGVALLDRDLTVLASSDASAVGRQEEDPFLREAWQRAGVQGRRLTRPDGREMYEVVKPFALEQKQVGLIRLDLSTEGIAGVAQQAQQSILWYSLGLLAVGIVGAVAIFWLQARHLAERRVLEEAMAREQRLSAVGNLAAGVAHEIRNPLNAISIGLQRLRKEFAPLEAGARSEYDRFAGIMQAEVGRLNTIVDRFLSLARPSRLALTEEPLAKVLEELVTLLSSQASAQAVRIKPEMALGEARVRMDRQQLTHAFMNVMLNAIQAMPGGGTLQVRAAVLPADRAALSGHSAVATRVAQVVVSDTGPGIAPEHLDRIFEPYFTTREGGTGLGLALTHKIVEEHGGSIRVESQVGSGATFVITLPLVQAP